MQLEDLEPHGAAECGVEVGQRLVEQEGDRLADDGAADGDPLALAAGELAGAALDVVAEVEDARGFGDLAYDRRPLLARIFSGKAMFFSTVICG